MHNPKTRRSQPEQRKTKEKYCLILF